MSRHKFWCRDRGAALWVWFCVTTATLQCETEVCRDRVFLYRDRVDPFGVATQSF